MIPVLSLLLTTRAGKDEGAQLRIDQSRTCPFGNTGRLIHGAGLPGSKPTSGHSRRVANLTAGAASAMGIKDAALVQIEHGALLHDIGKLKIPDGILWKPAKLTGEEWQIMRRHAEYGFEFLSNIGFLNGAAEIVYSHHEKYDGTGYPRGLEHDHIPLGARVFAIVDTVDAMIYKRPYNVPVSFPAAAAEVRRCSGSQFDPSLVETTLAYLDEHIPAHLK